VESLIPIIFGICTKPATLVATGRVANDGIASDAQRAPLTCFVTSTAHLLYIGHNFQDEASQTFLR
jgi:hypothetical protein